MNNIASFKVGDTVEAVRNNYVYTNLNKNWAGVIIGEDDYNFIAETTRTNDTEGFDKIGNSWFLQKSDFHEDFAHSKSNNFKTIYQILNDEL